MKERKPVYQETDVTYDDLTTEFEQWLSRRSRTDEPRSLLWSVFLLLRPDDRSPVYRRAMSDTIHGNNQKIARLVKDDRIDEARAWARLTKQMDEKE